MPLLVITNRLWIYDFNVIFVEILIEFALLETCLRSEKKVV